MDDNRQTVAQQTAPESTRGLFDSNEKPNTALPASNKASTASRRRTFNGPNLDSEADNRSKQSTPQRHGRGHQRSKSDMQPSQTNTGRSTNPSLHRLPEETDKDKAVAVDSIKIVIDTVQSLPPSTDTQKENEDSAAVVPNTSNSSRRGNRKSLQVGSAPLTPRSKRSSHHSHQRTTSAETPPNVDNITEDPKERRRSILSQLKPRHSSSEPGEDSLASRDAALAEAEAKLMGTFTKQGSGAQLETATENHHSHGSLTNDNRDISLRPGAHRNTDANGSHYDGSKHMSYQLPTVPEDGSDSGRLLSPNNGKASRRIAFSKPLNLGNDSNMVASSNRRSRTFDNDKRNLTSPMFPKSPRSASYRSSFHLVPFTPTRVNFPRDDANPHQRRPLYLAHLPFSALTPLLRARQLVRGVLRVNKRNRSDAFVSCEDLDADIYICGSRDRNRALEGDVVALRLVDVEKVLWEKKEKEEAKLSRNGGRAKSRLPDEEDENEIIFGGDDEVNVVKPKYCGAIVAILERAQNQVFSGTLTLMRPNNKRAEEEKAADEAHLAMTGEAPKKEAPRIAWFKATDKRVPLIAIPIEQAPQDFVENSNAYASRLFTGSIKRWPITSLHPFGTLERELGPIEDFDVHTKAILADTHVTDTDFTDAEMQCLPPIPFVLDEKTLQERRDLRTSRIFTLGPAGSNVRDNALSIQKLGDDTYEVGVHVSDVAHFIKPNSALDKEARARAVQVDLIHMSVPMVPRELTHQVTNLDVDQPRLAFSVIWKLSSSGKILDSWFGKTVVKSCTNLTLDDAQMVLDDKTIHCIENNDIRTAVENDIKMLFDIASRMRKARVKEGIFTETRDELAFERNADGDPLTMYLSTTPSSSIIAKEFLLLANTCVAQKIISQFPEQALLRRHAGPIEHKIRELREYAASWLGVTLDITSAGRLQASIERVQDAVVRKILSVIVLKTIQPPKYYCTGTVDIIKYAHYALNVPLFTHFTSPTKRFADIIVQRQLEATLLGEKKFYLDRDTVQKIAQHSNVKKEAGLIARHQSIQLFLARYIQLTGTAQQQADNSNVSVIRKEALVVAVFEQFFDVYVPDINLEKRIHLANLPVWRSEYNSRERMLSMYWKKGVDTTTGRHHPWSLSDDEDDEEGMDEDALFEEMQTTNEDNDNDHLAVSQPLAISNNKENTMTDVPSNQPQKSTLLQKQPQKPVMPSFGQNEPEKTTSSSCRPETSRSTGKNLSMMRARLSESTGYSAEQGSQSIKAMDKIEVIVSVEMSKTPPLIRVLAANPFA